MTTKVLDEPKTGSAQPNEAVANLGGKYLTFKLADEEYGVEVLKAREILQCYLPGHSGLFYTKHRRLGSAMSSDSCRHNR